MYSFHLTDNLHNSNFFSFSYSYLSKEKGEIKRVGITHILNAAQGTKFAQIDTNEDTYADLGIQFYGINAMDTPKCDLAKYFTPAAEFIHRAVEEKGM